MQQSFTPKHWISTLLLLYFSTSVFAGSLEQGYQRLEKAGKYGLQDEKGHVLVAPEYDGIGWSDGSFSLWHGLTGCLKNNKWQLLNVAQNSRMEGHYALLVPAAQNLIAAKTISFGSTLLYGTISAAGNTVLSFQYDHLSQAGPYLINGKRSGRGEWRFGIINAKGKALISPLYWAIRYVKDDVFEVSVWPGKKRIYLAGQDLMLPMEVDSVGQHKAGYTVFYERGKAGLIDEAGQTIVPPVLKEIKIEDADHVQLLPFDQWKVFSLEGELKRSFKGDKLWWNPKDYLVVGAGSHFSRLETTEKGLQLDSVNGGEAFQPTGKRIVKSRILSLEALGHGADNGLRRFDTGSKTDFLALNGDFAAQKTPEGWQIINLANDQPLPIYFDKIKSYAHGLCVVQHHGRQGVYSLQGHWVLTPLYRNITALGEQRYLTLSEQYIYQLQNADTVLYTSDGSLELNKGLLFEKNADEQYRLLSSFGHPLTPFAGDRFKVITPDTLVAFWKKRQLTVYTPEGKRLFQKPAVQDILSHQEDYLLAKIDGKYGFLDHNGKLRIANRYDGAFGFSEGLAPFQLLGHWGYINKTEHIIIQPLYDQVFPFQDGLARVEKAGKWGIIDQEGHAVLPLEYSGIEAVDHKWLLHKGAKTGLTQWNGKIISYAKYDQLIDLPPDHLLVEWNGEWGLVNYAGINLIPRNAQQIVYWKKSDCVLTREAAQWETKDVHSLNADEIKKYE